METVTIDKKALSDLIRLKEELDLIVESIELMNNKEFMASHRRAKEQIKKRQLKEWNEL